MDGWMDLWTDRKLRDEESCEIAQHGMTEQLIRLFLVYLPHRAMR